MTKKAKDFVLQKCSHGLHIYCEKCVDERKEKAKKGRKRHR